MTVSFNMCFCANLVIETVVKAKIFVLSMTHCDFEVVLLSHSLILSLSEVEDACNLRFSIVNRTVYLFCVIISLDMGILLR